MLTRQDATLIVHGSINRVTGQAPTSDTQRLIDVGVRDDSVSRLIDTIIGDLRQHKVGLVPHRRFLGDITLNTVIGNLVDCVMEISAPKLCSNPDTPHPQTYPYPQNCWCGYPV